MIIKTKFFHSKRVFTSHVSFFTYSLFLGWIKYIAYFFSCVCVLVFAFQRAATEIQIAVWLLVKIDHAFCCYYCLSFSLLVLIIRFAVWLLCQSLFLSNSTILSHHFCRLLAIPFCWMSSFGSNFKFIDFIEFPQHGTIILCAHTPNAALEFHTQNCWNASESNWRSLNTFYHLRNVCMKKGIQYYCLRAHYGLYGIHRHSITTFNAFMKNMSALKANECCGQY